MVRVSVYSNLCLKTIMVRLQEVLDRVNRGEERAIAQEELRRVREIISEQCELDATSFRHRFINNGISAKQMERLDKQMAPIRKVFNDRVQLVE